MAVTCSCCRPSMKPDWRRLQDFQTEPTQTTWRPPASSNNDLGIWPRDCRKSRFVIQTERMPCVFSQGYARIMKKPDAHLLIEGARATMCLARCPPVNRRSESHNVSGQGSGTHLLTEGARATMCLARTLMPTC